MLGCYSHLRDVFGSSGKFFLKVVGFKAREGSSLQFLVDDWMRVGPLSFLFPTDFKVVLFRKVSV